MPLVFDLVAGRHQLLFANAVDGLGLDRLYLTAEGEFTASKPKRRARRRTRFRFKAHVFQLRDPWGPDVRGGCNGRMLITTHVYDCVVCLFLARSKGHPKRIGRCEARRVAFPTVLEIDIGPFRVSPASDAGSRM